MKNMMSKQDLIAFEDDIALCLKKKQIRAPVHLSFDNEDQLIEIFQHVEPSDWICTSWRSHYHCLLKGVDPGQLKKDILDGRSIELCYVDHNIISSAIVGGNISIALGLSMDIKRKKGMNKVWCWVGDMTALAGQFHEAHEYAFNHDLPITFVIEDNGLSVCSKTLDAWGYTRHPYEDENYWLKKGEEVSLVDKCGKVWYYQYDLHKKYPHAGPGGARIQF